MFGIARSRAVDNFDLYSKMLKSQILLMMHTIDQIYAHTRMHTSRSTLNFLQSLNDIPALEQIQLRAACWVMKDFH